MKKSGTSLNSGVFAERSGHVLLPQQKRSREALSNIVIAAEKLLRKKGIDGFTITEVANLAKMPVGNIYRRFEGRDELLQALKEEVMLRIENSIIDRISKQKFSNIETVVNAFADAAVESISQDAEINHIFLNWKSDKFTSDIENGAAAHMRVYVQYREAITPFLMNLNKKKVEQISRVSFTIVAIAVTDKVKGGDPILNELSWTALAAEFGKAALQYIQAYL
jgi:AcrR family transcriptional regulator